MPLMKPNSLPYVTENAPTFYSCASLWRELQLKEDNEGRKERQRELEIMERELELKQRQLDMEKQKVTIKESFPNGGNVELTCYYDDSMQEKVRNLLKGNTFHS